MKRILFVAMIAISALALVGCDAVLEAFYPEFADDGEFGGDIEIIMEINNADDFSFLNGAVFSGSATLRLAVLDLSAVVEDNSITAINAQEIANIYHGSYDVANPDWKNVIQEETIDTRYSRDINLRRGSGHFAVLLYVDRDNDG